MGSRLADPVLPLQTCNPHLNAVRALMKPVTFRPPAIALDTLLQQSELQLKELRTSWVYLEGNPYLQCKVQAAGDAVGQVVRALKNAPRGEAL